MQIDFYQLAGTSPESVIATLSEKILGTGGRLLIVAEDEAFLARLDRLLWDQGPLSFVPHGLAGGSDDFRSQSCCPNSPDAPNQARAMLIADGVWREAALTYDRAFYLFDGTALEDARLAWKLLSGREGVERRYWANEARQVAAQGLTLAPAGARARRHPQFQPHHIQEIARSWPRRAPFRSSSPTPPAAT